MWNKIYRILVLLLMIILIAALLGGCTSQPSPAPRNQQNPTTTPNPGGTSTPAPRTLTEIPPTPTEEPAMLSVWIMDRVGIDGMVEAIAAIEKWETEAGIKVEVIEGAQVDMMGRINTALPAGEGPDVFMTTNGYLGSLYNAHLITPLEDSIAADELTKYARGAVDSFSLDGHILGIPLTADVNSLVYNKDLVPEPPQTMAELIVMSKELTTGEYYGLLYTIDSFWFSYPFVSAYGGYVFNWDGMNWDVKDIGFDNEGAIAGLQYVRDLVAAQNLMPADVTWDVMVSMFAEGKSAMILANPTMIPTFKDAGINVGVARIPRLENGKYPHPFATYTGLSVSALSDHQDEAQALAVYLGKHLPDRLYKAYSGNIPVYQPAIDRPDLANNAELAGWLSQLEESDPLPSISEMNFVWGPATTAFQSVIRGEATAAEAMKAAQAQILQGIEEVQGSQ